MLLENDVSLVSIKNAGGLGTDSNGKIVERYETIVNVKDFGAKGDGITDDTVAIQNAINTVSNGDGGTIFFPSGTYLIDGTNNSEHGGINIKANVRLLGNGIENTILKNYKDEWKKVIGSRGGDNMSIAHLTIDGNWISSTEGSQPVPLSNSALRGEGFVLYNGTGPVNNLSIDNVYVKNTGHYGIGLQNVAMKNANLTNLYFSNIGGDCIDIKSYDGIESDAVNIDNVVTFDGCGHNTPSVPGSEEDGHVNQAVIDIGGRCHVSNVFIYNLDSYKHGDGTETLGANGLRFRSPVPSNSNRQGSAYSTANNIYIESSKDVAEGRTDAKRIVGITINDEHINVLNASIVNCYWGVRIQRSGTGIITDPEFINMDNLNITGCRGESESYAVSCDTGSSKLNLSGIINDSDLGVRIMTNNNNVQFGVFNSTVGIDSIGATSYYVFNFDGNGTNSTAAGFNLADGNHIIANGTALS